MTTPVAHYCPECGAPHDTDAHFCESCGRQFEAATADEPATAVMPQPASPAPAPVPASATQSARSPWFWAAIAAGVIAVIAVAVALIVGLSGSDEQPVAAPGYPTQISGVLAPVGTANDRLSDDLTALDPGDAIADVQRARRAAVGATAGARGQAAAITPPSDQRTLATDTTAALRAEQTLLSAIAAAITRPSERTANALAAPGQAARDAWARVATSVPGAGGRIAGLDRLAAWARATAATAPATKVKKRAVNPQGASCGGFEGIFAVSATLTDCNTALRVAVAVVNGGTAAGYTCRSKGNPTTGADEWVCSNPAGAIITFSVTGDAPPADQPQDTPSDVPSDVPQDTPSDVPSDVPQDTPTDVAPDDGSVG